MWDDPIVAEIRKIRDEHAKRFNYDLHAMFDDMRKRQDARGGRVVSLPPKRIPIPTDGSKRKPGESAA